VTKPEQVFVKAFVPQPAIEAFDQAILHRFASPYTSPASQFAILIHINEFYRRTMFFLVSSEQ